jgi:hypothetical protein
MNSTGKMDFILLSWIQLLNCHLRYLSAYSLWDRSEVESRMPTHITLTRDEAIAILVVLKQNWIPLDQQKIVFDLIVKIEKELEDKLA